MNKVPRKSGKRSYFVLEKSGKPQSDFCTNPVSTSLAVNLSAAECCHPVTSVKLYCMLCEELGQNHYMKVTQSGWNLLTVSLMP